MSKNHQFLELNDKVYKRYIKTGFAILTGSRPDPHDIRARKDFLLKTEEDKVSWETEVNPQDKDHIVLVKPVNRKIDYESEVLETYSEVEDRVFRQLNKKLFESGALAEYHEVRSTDIDMTNALTDSDVFRIANLPSIPLFKKNIKPITSRDTLDRIEQQLINLDRKPSFKQALAEHRQTIL